MMDRIAEVDGERARRRDVRAQQWLERLTDPDEVGQSEYRAIYESLNTGTEGMSYEIHDQLVAILDEFAFQAARMKAELFEYERIGERRCSKCQALLRPSERTETCPTCADIRAEKKEGGAR